MSDAHRRVGGVHALPTRAEGELATEVRALLADAERTNSAEDAVHGDRRGEERSDGSPRPNCSSGARGRTQGLLEGLMPISMYFLSF